VVNAEFGMRCTKCGSTFGTRIGGDPDVCPSCGGALVPNEGADTFMNVTCASCNTFFGLTGSPTCPTCGTPWPR
jgi:rRNA maturation endonuclease Nob1